MLLVCLFVNFARVNFCLFVLPLGVRACLRLLIVALPRLFYELFCVGWPGGHLLGKKVTSGLSER